MACCVQVAEGFTVTAIVPGTLVGWIDPLNARIRARKSASLPAQFETLNTSDEIMLVIASTMIAKMQPFKLRYVLVLPHCMWIREGYVARFDDDEVRHS